MGTVPYVLPAVLSGYVLVQWMAGQVHNEHAKKDF
jgi:hypothetical protein